ncbi:MAG: maltose alpha-D-glucosyltransferase [Alphaproteobacteria bacterium]|nr:maltose alpha-D-glucosyltransferase [Alphaproteobacteria bacterium]
MLAAPGDCLVLQKAPQITLEPHWYKDAVVYQLHVKSFFDANNDGTGDFPGLIEKLDYIAAIGVTAIWLLPFYPSPRRDDGYDISEYRGVHPEYGTLADFRRFISEAHKRGLRVITELVVNHTSDQHRWFRRARKAKPGSAARNYYVWSDNDRKYAGTRIIFIDAEKSNWTWDDEAQAYFWHRFYSHQPDLNFENPQVLRSVLSVMRFWLDLGVDGLRLDAVPYLIEREGTINENLPETHEVLKRIRFEIDARYPDRMLLAEANQWPEDVQVYFGNGDECHMAFHFPLMPRMYMAIAQEDRFPITDILRQTPSIPDSCQWAIFLRNHDELTLEMVTDRERDYLWKTYASDPRARLNLGIRRRLAPLLERDRRRVELMKSLLLTMPGTPVVYYGDEIGMGDNLHLGDRDGVRTPMQWSSDRNGGFSRADPASLVLPPIMDPLYGFGAVNVEAQWRDTHSLLNWFRRMVVERRKHRAFGRGSIRFLNPQNRKVLAYLREFDDETILCVANVARTAQAVELNLSEFAGRVPVELSGDTAFPMIGQLTYLLTLPSYGFYWFLLSAGAAPPVWSAATAAAPVEQHTFVLRDGLTDIGKGDARAIFNTQVLPPYVRGRRWFQQKEAADAKIEVVMLGRFASSDDLVYAEITADDGSRTEHYALPLSVSWDDVTSQPFEAPLALARVRKGRRVGFLTDAFATPVFAHELLSHLRAPQKVDIGQCALEFRPTDIYAQIDIPPNAELEWPAAEQTNSTLIIGRKAIIKLLRRLVPGIHPEGEMTRLLTERGFGGTPPMLGEVVRISSSGEVATVAVAQGYVANQGDGWRWTLDRLGRIADEAATPFGEQLDNSFANYTPFARRAGRRIGEMHTILAEPTEDTAFAPEKMDEMHCHMLAERVIDGLKAAIETARSIHAPEASDLLTNFDRRMGEIASAVSEAATIAAGRLRTRIHGDLHLGQLLLAGDDVMIIDFEGEPSKSIEERRQKDLPLHDVAGMLRSFYYAAAVVERGLKQGSQEGHDRALAVLERYREIASQALLGGYEEGIGRPLNNDDKRLMQLYMLEKAAYELRYEASNRPDWLAVPLRGLIAASDSLLEKAGDA